MKLVVKNLGVIHNAEIVLQGITVIAGKNGLGKSTLGKILYCLCHMLYRAEDKVNNEIEQQIFSILRKNIPFENKVIRREATYREAVRQVIARYRDTGEIILPDGVTEMDESGRSLYEMLRTVLEINKKDILTTLLERSIYAEIGRKINPINHSRRKMSVSLEWSGERKVIITKEKNKKLELELSGGLLEDAVFIDDPYILDFASEFPGISFLFNRFSHKVDLAEKILHDPDRDSVINNIIAEQSWKELESLINDMCDGAFSREGGNSYNYVSPSLKEPLEAESLSMGLKSILLLKTLIENGSLNNTGYIIFDEPEIHLHPEWQFKLANVIVLLPKVFDIKVIVSTHSSDFLSAMNYYSMQYGMQDKARYYLLKKEGEYSVVEDVSEKINLIYQELSAPFLKIADQI